MNPFSEIASSFFEERDRWFLWLPVLIAGGIVVYFNLPEEPSLWFLALSPALFLLSLPLRHYPFLHPLVFGFLAFFAGLNAAQLETHLVQGPLLGSRMEPVSVTGTLMRAEPLEEGARLTLKQPSIKGLSREERPAFVRIKVKTPFEDLPAPGSRVNVWGPLWPPNDPVAPGGYDFRRHAYFKQLGATGLSYVEPRTYESKYPLPFFWDGFSLFFERARRALILMSIERLDPPQEAITTTLLSGTQAGIEDDIMEDMRASGLSHLLSISGVHVSMMGLLVYFPLRFLLALFPWIALRFPIKKWAALAAIVATSFYTILVGADAPTVRSALMTGIVLFAMIADRKAMSLRIVALAAILIMLVTPSAVMGPSFQMSFAAVLAMVAFYEKKLDAALKEGFSLALPVWLKKIGFHGKDIVITSLLATAATTPFTLFHFQTFSFYGVIANILALPLTSLWIMPCLLMTYITAPFGMAGPFIDGAGWGVDWIIKIAHMVASWPYAKIDFPPMPFAALALVLSGGLWLCLWQRKWRWLGLLPIAAACLYPLYVKPPLLFIAHEEPVWAINAGNDTMLVFGKTKENFLVSQWRQMSANPQVRFYNKRNLPDLDSPLLCDDRLCLFEKDGISLVFWLPLDEDLPQTPLTQEACLPVSLIIAQAYHLDCPSVPVIDAKALAEHGAHTVYLQEGALSILRVREKRGARPWSSRPLSSAEEAPPASLEP